MIAWEAKEFHTKNNTKLSEYFQEATLIQQQTNNAHGADKRKKKLILLFNYYK